MVHATNHEIIVKPTRGKWVVVLSPAYNTASEATAAARKLRAEWPEGSFQIEIREVSGA
jgi:hypothetical protein